MQNLLLWGILAMIWSSSFLAIKIGIGSIAPLTLVALRMIIGSALLLVMMRIGKLSLPTDGRSWLILIVSGLMGSIIPFSLISFGELHVESGLAALLMGITPVVTVSLAPLIHVDERLTFKAIIGVVAGVLGLVVLVGPEALGGFGQHVSGQFAILGAALCYSFTTLFVRRYAALPALVMAAGSMLSGTIIVVIAALIIDQPFQAPMPSSESLTAAVYLGLFPTAIATLIYFYLVPRIGAARISQVNFVVPVLGALLGMMVLGESFGVNALIALLLILVAVTLVSGNTGSRRVAGVEADR